jgi:hypothetical protein
MPASPKGVGAQHHGRFSSPVPFDAKRYRAPVRVRRARRAGERCGGSPWRAHHDRVAVQRDTGDPGEHSSVQRRAGTDGDLDEPIFYSGNYYWRNQGGFWYRSTSHTRGWARVEVAPAEIRTIERPSAYVHYHGEARAQVSGKSRGPVPPAVARDHRQVVAPAPRRDDKHDRDRHDNDGHDRDDRRHD